MAGELMDLTDDQQVLAGTIWGESRGEPEKGREAVAAVVMNRVAIAKRHMSQTGKPHPLFGDGTVRSACLMPYQFSCWNDGDPNRAKILALDFAHPDPLLNDCLAVAARAIAGILTDWTHGATHYKEASLSWPHGWGPECTPLAEIGHHAFYQIA